MIFLWGIILSTKSLHCFYLKRTDNINPIKDKSLELIASNRDGIVVIDPEEKNKEKKHKKEFKKPVPVENLPGSKLDTIKKLLEEVNPNEINDLELKSTKEQYLK